MLLVHYKFSLSGVFAANHFIAATCARLWPLVTMLWFVKSEVSVGGGF